MPDLYEPEPYECMQITFELIILIRSKISFMKKWHQYGLVIRMQDSKEIISNAKNQA